MPELLSLLLLCGLVAAGVALLLYRLRPSWSRLRASLVAALIVPVLTLLLCLRLVVDLGANADRGCDLFVCGVVIQVAVMFLFQAFVCLGTGFITGRASRWLVEQR